MTASDARVYFLLVDDIEENLLALEALLKRPGLVLLKCRSGREALELLLKHEIALALLDVQMPEMDGFELAELMRGAERTQRVPIIFLTAGSADAQRRFRGYDAGAVDFLYKPIEPHILRSKANVFFELYRQRQDVAAQRDELKNATEQIARLLAESRRSAIALKEADRRKDEFLAMLAHELRNPLAPIRNAVEILRLSHETTSHDSEAAEIIARQVAHMSRLIDDLLDVARIARGKIELRQDYCDLGEIVRQTTADYSHTFAASGVRLVLEFADEPLPVFGDRIRLAQILGNLLHNASKFTPSGGTVTVSTRLDRSLDAGVIRVSDTGIGLEQKAIATIFEPFNQADQSFDRAMGGLGLGLALAKGLTELHGGSISADSPGVGQGATFVVTIPLDERLASPQRDNGEAEEATPHRPLRLLVIEDNADAAISLQRLLEILGHEVKIAFDGQTGFQLAQSFRPHVVMSDLGLPGGLDGYGVARLLRDDPQTRGLYLIALSGYGHEECRERAHDAGFDKHLVKPVELSALKRVLADAATRNGT